MNCDQVRTLIEDYLDGELAEGRVAQLQSHLQHCAGCRRELAMLEGEARVYDAYAAKVEGSLDIPPGLHERAVEGAIIEPRPLAYEKRAVDRAPWWSSMIPVSSWARQALAAALLIAISITGTLLIVEYRRAKEPAAPGQAARVGPGDQSLDAALKSVQRAEQEYLNAIQMLTVIVDREKSTLNPGLLAELQQNLEMIDQHIAATRKAYYAHPTDADLAISMLAAYSRKVELLQDLAS
jgi:anti-sigma factor RsiW